MPADDPCVNTPPADAYWGLWWSDGTTGKWTYSSLGAASLARARRRVRRDGLGRLHGHRRPGRERGRPPDADAHPHAHEAADRAPAPDPDADGDALGDPDGDADHGHRVADHEAHAEADAEAHREADSLRLTHRDTVRRADPRADRPASERSGVDGPSDDGGLPGWVPPVLVVVLLGVAGAVAVVRRRR